MLWIAYPQARIITVSDDLLSCAREVRERPRADRVRVEIDETTHSFNKEICNGTTEKIPVLLVIGRKEAEEGTVTVRRYKIHRQETLPVAEFHALLLAEIRERRHVKPEA